MIFEDDVVLSGFKLDCAKKEIRARDRGRLTIDPRVPTGVPRINEHQITSLTGRHGYLDSLRLVIRDLDQIIGKSCIW